MVNLHSGLISVARSAVKDCRVNKEYENEWNSQLVQEHTSPVWTSQRKYKEPDRFRGDLQDSHFFGAVSAHDLGAEALACSQ